MKKKLIIIGIIITIASCNDEKRNSLQQKDSISFKKVEPQIDTSSKQKFNIFWRDFREAVLKKDSLKLMDCISIPLKTRGTFDDDPIIQFKSGEVVKVLLLFLNQWNGLDLNNSSELDYIKKHELIEETSNNDDKIRISDMIFSYRSGKWQLTFLYLNEDTIEVLKKSK